MPRSAERDQRTQAAGRPRTPTPRSAERGRLRNRRQPSQKSLSSRCGDTYRQLMATTGTVRVWYQASGWGIIDSAETPDGVSADAGSIRVEAVADLAGFPMMGLRPGTDVEFEWSDVAPPINDCRYVASVVWPLGAPPPPSRSGSAFATALWNSVGEPGPDGLTVMREADLAELDTMPVEKPRPLPTAVGTVRLWRDNDGWGVIDSESTPGGAWAHFSEIVGTGFRTLSGGQVVEFDYEDHGQDGYAFRANNIRGR